jgi:molecular chaperone DnaK
LIISAWKTATEAMYAQGEQGQDEANKRWRTQGDDVQDVDYEEVK